MKNHFTKIWMVAFLLLFCVTASGFAGTGANSPTSLRSANITLYDGDTRSTFM